MLEFRKLSLTFFFWKTLTIAVYIQQKNPVVHSFLEVQSSMMQKAQDELSVSLYPGPLASNKLLFTVLYFIFDHLKDTSNQKLWTQYGA